MQHAAFVGQLIVPRPSVDPEASLPASPQTSRLASSSTLSRPASSPSLVSAPPSVSTGARRSADEMRASQMANGTTEEQESGFEEEVTEGPAPKRSRRSKGGRGGQACRGGRGVRARRKGKQGE
ncbi:hypothetical protein L198_06300 [Cryptococcus wingfieldii CBS 7118]|uniref:Uncharacterized protein n=1 Tax=Cryptococcus wingfieldii CBS 7118 TaxID=1295528 RepID=A0A1E3ILY5_9TREE|nr:hypothetical protein L198_06300 [Cryptococcus wingfieldii CBS 7118]ODN89613.1 hypothetical protein L198_06300 [Cryptococcus wingfieldii CBS 7118]